VAGLQVFTGLLMYSGFSSASCQRNGKRMQLCETWYPILSPGTWPTTPLARGIRPNPASRRDIITCCAACEGG